MATWDGNHLETWFSVYRFEYLRECVHLHAGSSIDCIILGVELFNTLRGFTIAKRHSSGLNGRPIRAQEEKLTNSHGLRNGRKSPEPMDGLNSDSDHSSSPVPNGSPSMRIVQTLPNK